MNQRTAFSWHSGAVVALGLFFLMTGADPALSCNYGTYGLKPGDSSQATVDGLFRGIYNETKGWRVDRWREEASMAAERATDVPGKLSQAWALQMMGQPNQANAIYQALLQQDPDQYETLCSYATALHAQRNYTLARQMLQRAVALKPGFRNRAEELHLNMIEYEVRSRNDFNYARENIFIPELTPLWKNRRGVDENFSTVAFPPGLSSKGLAELLRQYPDYGEGWLALGMLLEHEKDFSTAAKAYDRALERGTAHATELKKYMATFREFGREHDPGRVVGRGIVRLAIGVGSLLIFLGLYRVVARVIWDVTSHRAAKQEAKRREQRKSDNGPL